jgi:hypothetical protein
MVSFPLSPSIPIIGLAKVRPKETNLLPKTDVSGIPPSGLCRDMMAFLGIAFGRNVVNILRYNSECQRFRGWFWPFLWASGWPDRSVCSKVVVFVCLIVVCKFDAFLRDDL